MLVEHRAAVRHSKTVHGSSLSNRPVNLDHIGSSCLTPFINTARGFVQPNKLGRIGPRADAAKAVARSLRSACGGRPMLCTTPAAVNWRSGGMSDPVDVTAASDPVWTLDCDAGSVLITNEIEGPRLVYDFRVRDLGWDLVTVPWFDATGPVAAACEYAGVVPDELLSDTEGIGKNIRDQIVAARLALGDAEREE